MTYWVIALHEDKNGEKNIYMAADVRASRESRNAGGVMTTIIYDHYPNLKPRDYSDTSEKLFTCEYIDTVGKKVVIGIATSGYASSGDPELSINVLIREFLEHIANNHFSLQNGGTVLDEFYRFLNYKYQPLQVNNNFKENPIGFGTHIFREAEFCVGMFYDGAASIWAWSSIFDETRPRNYTESSYLESAFTDVQFNTYFIQYAQKSETKAQFLSSKLATTDFAPHMQSEGNKPHTFLGQIISLARQGREESISGDIDFIKLSSSGVAQKLIDYDRKQNVATAQMQAGVGALGLRANALPSTSARNLNEDPSRFSMDTRGRSDVAVTAQRQSALGLGNAIPFFHGQTSNNDPSRASIDTRATTNVTTITTSQTQTSAEEHGGNNANYRARQQLTENQSRSGVGIRSRSMSK